MGDALTIEVRQEQGDAIVTAAGKIDISTVTRLRERLLEAAAGGSPLLVDLDQVTSIDSVGLATLAGAAKRVAAHGGGLQVACARPKIRELLRLTGLNCPISQPASSTRPRSLPRRWSGGQQVEWKAAWPIRFCRQDPGK